MQRDLIVVFGGSGFIGRQVVRALAKRGAAVRVPMRVPHLGHELRVMGDVGQIQLFQANIRNAESVKRALKGATGVVNCVGLLSEKGKQSFQLIQADGAATIARAAKEAGVQRFVQISAIGADAASKSRYARTKAAAETAVRAAMPNATILRPSIVFGPEDSFFNRFADMAKFAPALPLIGGGKTKFQPVFVGDVAEAVCAALTRPDAQGRTYELGGPRVYTFKELLAFTLAQSARKRPLVPLPFFLAQPLGVLLDWLFRLNPFGDAPLTGDQVTLLRTDNIVAADGEVGTIADLGVVELETIETIAPTYLWRFRPHGQFEAHPA
ncbi:MAG: NAD-dependent epimerase/dehydratase family protein [Alphaproteobacteria bacterium]|nr:NAD-dependent epimerase/dehydratase family protein [Alphaproteobacteria bacterium]